MFYCLLGIFWHIFCALADSRVTPQKHKAGAASDHIQMVVQVVAQLLMQLVVQVVVQLVVQLVVQVMVQLLARVVVQQPVVQEARAQP